MMKTLFITALWACAFFTHSLAQDLSNLNLEAEYTFLNSAQDATGTYGEAEVINAPFMDTCGIFSHGGYLFDVVDEDSSFVGTPPIAALQDEQFAVQVEFKVDSIESRSRPVIVVGDGWRYLGLFLWDGAFRVLHNDALYTPDLEVVPQAGQWHTFTVYYNRGQEASYYFIDGQQIWARADTLVRPENDLRITNTHAGFGWTFRGYWRNLQVMSSDVMTSAREVRPSEELLVTPNPAYGQIAIDLPLVPGKVHQLRVSDMSGKVISQSEVSDDKVQLDGLPQGIHVVQLFRDGTLAASRKIFILPY